jgi:hypothetical protein
MNNEQNDENVRRNEVDNSNTAGLIKYFKMLV